jgi:hypothetical protein
MTSIYTGEAPFNPNAYDHLDAIRPGLTRRGLRIISRQPNSSWEGACIFCGQSLVVSEEQLTRWHSDVCACRYARTR